MPRVSSAILVVALCLFTGCEFPDQTAATYFQLEVHASGRGWGPYYRIRVDSERLTVDEFVGSSVGHIVSIDLDPSQARQLQRYARRVPLPQPDIQYSNPEVDDGASVVISIRRTPNEWPAWIVAENCRVPRSERLLLAISSVIEGHGVIDDIPAILEHLATEHSTNPVCSQEMVSQQDATLGYREPSGQEASIQPRKSAQLRSASSGLDDWSLGGVAPGSDSVAVLTRIGMPIEREIVLGPYSTAPDQQVWRYDALTVSFNYDSEVYSIRTETPDFPLGSNIRVGSSIAELNEMHGQPDLRDEGFSLYCEPALSECLHFLRVEHEDSVITSLQVAVRID